MKNSSLSKTLPYHASLCDLQRYYHRQPFMLDSGGQLSDVEVAYATYGELNEEKSNAILVCHALTGDQFASGHNRVTGKAGWWSTMVRPGGPIDTNKYFVICSNVLGGCAGTTGPGSVNPETGLIYGIDFPHITIADMVRLQFLLVESFGIRRLLSVVGGSVGGMQVLQWAADYKDHIQSAIAIATAAQESPRNIALHEVSRQAIMADPDWSHGRYLEEGKLPRRGLAVARMAAHVNYLTPEKIALRFGRGLEDPGRARSFHDAEFTIERYLHYQGASFVNRFDANTYLYLTKAIDHFDLAAAHHGMLPRAFRGARARFCIIAFSSDWLQPPTESKKLVRALNAVGADVTYSVIETNNGHDAFLLKEPTLEVVISNFLSATAAHSNSASN